ncbi:PAS domain-containing protein [Rhizobium calliandrae]|uniref:PAS domain-containing protein n=1 Tax=Rhizobium calliandrae TaxID=1312182 RepID=A0ABT7KFB0_9HYPH|nr:PAS domain-containing protein [Rhizobium calliandrae]MDL2407310.1 PAS domain-containing protein [Rhizobium calliandrae]
MRQKNSVEIFTYWEQLRGNADAPLRNLIEPSAVRHILPELFILEAVRDQAPRFRLAGTAICSLMGRELRFESFAALWAGGQPDDAVRIAAGVMEHVVPALIKATGYSIGGRHVTFEMVLMPLRSAGDVCDRLLGCLTPTAHTPWLGSERLEFLALDRSRMLYERPAHLVEPPSDPEHANLISRHDGVGLGALMARMLHPNTGARNQGPADPLRHSFGRRL